MSEAIATSAGRAAKLRQALDQSFTLPAAADSETTIDLISIRVCDCAYAVRLGEIAGLHTDMAVTPMPSPVTSFRGLSAYRSTLTPVYDLAALLGGAAAPAPRWTMLVASARVALAFDAFDHHWSVAPGAINPTEPGRDAGHVHAIVPGPSLALPLIDITSVVSAIRSQMPHSFRKEQ